MTSILRVEDVTKAYDNGFVANDGISLSVEEGEVFGLLGPNGAGKTTLVSQIMGLLRPDSGQILYRDRMVSIGDQALKRRMGYLSQRSFALLDFTVREAILFTGRLRGLTSKAAMRQCSELIELFSLESCADRVVVQLSGGQQRLASLASALAGTPETLILDEPTNDLDPEMRARVWATLRERRRSQGTTVVLVTHNPLEAEQVIERLGILMTGRLIAFGSPGQIKSNMDDRVRLEMSFRDGFTFDALALPAWIPVTSRSGN